MKNYPIENQVCSLEQAKELAELLGDDAPGSLWSGVDYISWNDIPGYDVDAPRFCNDLMLSAEIKSFKRQKRVDVKNIYPAYTGDELGALLPPVIWSNSSKYSLDSMPFESIPDWCVGYRWVNDYAVTLEVMRAETEARAKAALAIKGLREGWIKKEDFRYE